MLADLRFEHVGSVLVARVSGDVDLSNAGDIGAALGRTLGNDDGGLVLDLTAVDYFDSAGIHLVFDLRERLEMRGLSLRLVVPPGAQARTSLTLAGVLRAIDVDETLDRALVALSA